MMAHYLRVCWVENKVRQKILAPAQDLREMHFLWWLVLGALAAIWFFRVFFSAPKLDGCRRTVLVTGAGSGLGRATCLKLAAAGDFVIAMDMNLSALEKLSVRGPKFLRDSWPNYALFLQS